MTSHLTNCTVTTQERSEVKVIGPERKDGGGKQGRKERKEEERVGEKEKIKTSRYSVTNEREETEKRVEAGRRGCGETKEAVCVEQGD